MSLDTCSGRLVIIKKEGFFCFSVVSYYKINVSLQEWTRARHIRLRLLKVKTLLADLLPLARQDPSVTRRVCFFIINIDGTRKEGNRFFMYCLFFFRFSMSLFGDLFSGTVATEKLCVPSLKCF